MHTDDREHLTLQSVHTFLSDLNSSLCLGNHSGVVIVGALHSVPAVECSWLRYYLASFMTDVQCNMNMNVTPSR